MTIPEKDKSQHPKRDDKQRDLDNQQKGGQGQGAAGAGTHSQQDTQPQGDRAKHDSRQHPGVEQGKTGPDVDRRAGPDVDRRTGPDVDRKAGPDVDRKDPARMQTDRNDQPGQARSQEHANDANRRGKAGQQAESEEA